MGRDYYSILGVSRDADDDAIKKAYKKQAMKWHPDRNPDNQEAAKKKFQDVSEAFEVLSDPQRRQIFDQFGEEGLKAGGPSGGGGGMGGGAGPHFQGFHASDAEEIFNAFFGSSRFGGGMGDEPFLGMGGGGFEDMFQRASGRGGFGRFGGARRPMRKPEPVVHNLPLTLEELYTGTTKKLQITRKRFEHSGQAYNDTFQLVIEIRAGWKAGTKLTYEGHGDEVTLGVKQDIVFIIKEKPHSRFTRDGNNLVYTAPITLKEALCGTHIPIVTLDGRKLRLPITTVVAPDDVRHISNEGMPLAKAPTRKGDLVLKFRISFPRSLTQDQKQHLSAILQ